jgi:hypothetical protein
MGFNSFTWEGYLMLLFLLLFLPGALVSSHGVPSIFGSLVLRIFARNQVVGYFENFSQKGTIFVDIPN